MKKLKIGVLFGGKSTEHSVSVVSGSSILKYIDKEKYEVNAIFISKDGTWYEYLKDTFEVLNIGEEPKELKVIQNIIEYLKVFDLILPILHGKYGEDGSIQGLLEMIGTSYVGCDILSSSLCMDKVYAKYIFEKARINQAKYIVINYKNDIITYINESLEHNLISFDDLDLLILNKLKYPIFIKASNSGSSIGVYKANNKDEMIDGIINSSKYDEEILLEEEIVGKEVECAVLNGVASTVGEVLSAGYFYTFDSKYKNSESKTLIPSSLSLKTQEEIQHLAVKAFKSLKCKNLSRVDFFVMKNDKIYINEINTMPGFTNISMFPKLWEYDGISYTKLIDKLIKEYK